jgi:hypothetical protein
VVDWNSAVPCEAGHEEVGKRFSFRRSTDSCMLRLGS